MTWPEHWGRIFGYMWELIAHAASYPWCRLVPIIRVIKSIKGE